MSLLRSAIVGCGPRGEAHARVYDRVKHGEMVACCDLDESRLHAFRDRYGIAEGYTDMDEMMQNVGPDLLHIVTHPSLRWEIISRALVNPPQAILVEKPLAMRPEEGLRILEACEKAGVALFVNHQLRQHEPHQKLRETVLSGDLGDIEWVKISSRGNLLDQGTHVFDLVNFVFDDPGIEWVLAQATGCDPDGSPHYTTGSLTLKGGVRVAFECGSPAPTWRGEPNYWYNKGIEVMGTRGRAGASINHGWWVQIGASWHEYPVPYGEEDDRAQARLTDTIFQALSGGDDAIASHPNNAWRSEISFAGLMAAQLSAWHRAPVAADLSLLKDADIDALIAQLKIGDASSPIVALS